ncbi:MAG: hypothetical protein ABSD11_14110 [Methylocella sp.]|jgi:hypothetical protein
MSKKKSSESKPHRPKQSNFLLWPLDRMRPLAPDQGAIEAAMAAFEILNSEHSDVVTTLGGGYPRNGESATKDVEPTHPAYLALRDITHTYWFERRVYERKSIAEFNAELVKIQNAIANLQTALSDAPRFVRGRLDVQLLFYSKGDKNWLLQLSQEFASNTPLQSIEIVLNELATASKKNVEKGGGSGARPKCHVTTAAARLVELWRRAGKDFEWRFDRAKGTGPPSALEFVGKGPQFVWRLMSIIDPDLSIGEVRSVLKNLSRKRSGMSNNSPSA